MSGDREYSIACLSACLALVRPVGMTEGETVDWLEVAADTVAHIPPHILDRGARAARTTCTHHAQIVPAIIAATASDLSLLNRPKSPPVLRLVEPENPYRGQPLPDPSTLPPELRRIGIAAGWLAEREGQVVWTEAGAA